MIEQWRDIPTWDGYQASSFGNIRAKDRRIVVRNHTRPRKGRILQFSYNKKGYREVRLARDRKPHVRLVHKLVCSAFGIIKLPHQSQINHINGIKTDNRPENLAWCTASENITHAYKMGLMCKKGENHSRCKLKLTEVQEIRSLYNKKEGRTQKFLAQKFNIAQGHVSAILRGITWK